VSETDQNQQNSNSLQLQQHLQQQLKEGPEATEYLVAYSTGADSTALLHALSQLKPSQRLIAVHVDHGLQPQSKEWAQLARCNCDKWGIPLQLEQVTVHNDGHGLEAAARDARYAAIQKHATETTVVLTAHHAGDQAETLLLNLLRGSGLRGLAGMPVQRDLGNSTLFRPLLQLPNEILLDYCQQQQLSYCEDSSNDDLRFDRNWVRHELMSLIKTRFPKAEQNFTFSTQLLRQSLLFTQQQIQQQLEKMCLADSSLCLNDWRQQPDFLQQDLLRAFCRKLNQPPPRQQLTEFIRQLNQAGTDKTPTLNLQNHSLRTFQQRLYIVDSKTDSSIDKATWLKTNHWQWPGVGQLHIHYAEMTNVLNWPQFEVRQRQGGEQILLSDGHHHRLKKLFQEAQIPPWKRQYLPLIYHRGRLVAVADQWLHPALQRWLKKRSISWQWDAIK